MNKLQESDLVAMLPVLARIEFQEAELAEVHTIAAADRTTHITLKKIHKGLTDMIKRMSK